MQSIFGINGITVQHRYFFVPAAEGFEYASRIDEEFQAPVSPAELRALAHPLRVQLLHLLRIEGASTASELGRRLGESSGSTSYHLRVLHRVGMIAECERRNGRERWWSVVGTRRLIPNSIDPALPADERAELQAAHAQVESIILERDEQALERWESLKYDLPLEWQDAGFLGSFRVWGTADEIKDLVALMLSATAKLQKRRDERASDARELNFTMRVLPQAREPDAS
ncbi:MAG: helix-turn-helix domain-containing protein [Gaiellaceae bacterium]